MSRTIHEHHALKGLRFSVVEFLVMAIVAWVLAASAFAAGGSLAAALLVGIGLNCLVVAGLGLVWLRAGEPDQPLSATFSAAARARVLEQHPDAQRGMNRTGSGGGSIALKEDGVHDRDQALPPLPTAVSA